MGEGEEEPHELEHLVVDRPGEEEEEDYYHQQEGGAYRDMRNGPAGAAPGSSRQGMGAGMGVEERDAQVIYDVGENPSDEDGEEEEDEKRRR